ncbi:MAG: hypothetical protein ABI577_13890 [bacterium]
MTTFAARQGTVASSIARAWLRVYSFGLPSALRERRATELESDLFEHESDAFASGASPGIVGIEIIGRLVRGMPADLMWRFQLEGPQMELNIPFERVTGLLLLALVLLIPVAVGIDGYDTTQVGWASELSRLGGVSATQTRVNVAIQIFSGLALVCAAAGFYAALAPRAKNLSVFAAFAMAAAGVVTFATSAMYFATSTLADDYVAGRGGDDILVTSRALALAMQNLGGAAGVLLTLSVCSLAVAAHKHGLVPGGLKWVLAFSFTCVLVGLAWQISGRDAWFFLMGGLLTLLLWLLAAGSCLLAGVGGHPRQSELGTSAA